MTCGPCAYGRWAERVEQVARTSAEGGVLRGNRFAFIGIRLRRRSRSLLSQLTGRLPSATLRPDSSTQWLPVVSRRNHVFTLKLTVTVRTNRSGRPFRSNGEYRYCSTAATAAASPVRYPPMLTAEAFTHDRLPPARPAVD